VNSTASSTGLATALEGVGDAVVVYDASGQVHWASDSLATTFGWDPDSIRGTEFLMVAPDQLGHATQQTLDALAAGEDSFSYQVEVQHGDGTMGLAHVRASLVRDGAGDISHVITVLRALGDGAREPHASATNDSAFQSLVNASTDVVTFTVDSRFTWVSSNVLHLIGWPADELVDHGVLGHVHPDEIASVVNVMRRVSDDGRGKATFRIRNPDGSSRWVEATTQSFVAADGTEGRLSTIRDMTTTVEVMAALEESETGYRLLAENASDVVYRIDPKGSIVWVSPSVREALGWTAEELLGWSSRDLVHPDDVGPTSDWKSLIESGESPPDFRCRYRTADGAHRWMSVRARALVADDGSVLGAVAGLRDVDAEVEATRALADSERLFRSSLESAAIGTAIVGLDRKFVVVNPALRSMLGRDEEWFATHELGDVVHPDDLAAVREEGMQLFNGERDHLVTELRLLRPDGTVVRVRRSAAVVRDEDGAARTVLFHVEDVTAEHEAHEALAYQAFHDPLTGLRNRAWILDILGVDLEAARLSESAVGALFVDLDNFKVVNDSLGHAAGDEVLAAVAERITSSLKQGHRVGRFGGDEFVIVIPGVQEVQDLELIAHRVSDAIARDLQVHGHRIVPTASIGIAVSTDVSTPESLLRDTDSALFRAKEAGRAQWQFFDSAMHARALERLMVEDQLRDAIARHEFVVYYQRIVGLRSGAVVGHEALVRWQHPERGLLSPGDFLDVAEDSGLISHIGAQVLDEVCAKMAAHPRMTSPTSVNASAVELAQPGWIDGYAKTLARHGISPNRLVVEVTETAVLDLLGPTRHALRALRELGSGIHVDDFGTGFSSISLLRDLPVTGLKLDRTFVSDLTEGVSSANALASGLAGLAAGLGLDAIAEGIETPMQAEILRQLGWDLGQGYLYGRPSPEPWSDEG
jgi:diguanylate cyclase (GGDEF)-like protein/PAS domain S-box-containing protein